MNKVFLVDQSQYMVSSTLALLFFPSDIPIVSRAAAPEGQCPVEYRGYFVRTSAHPSFRGPAFKVLAWEPWPGGPGLGALDWGH